MVVREVIELQTRQLVKHYSDANFLIQKVGTDEYYVEAIDPIEFETERVYEETDIPVDDPEENIDKAEEVI